MGEISKLKIDYLIKGFSLLDYSVINLSVRDFVNGGEFVKSLTNKYSNIDFISANIYYKDTAKHFAKPYVIKRVKARTSKGLPFKKLAIGIIGLCEKRETLFSNRFQEKMLEAKPPLDIAKTIVPQLRKKVDLVIVLFHGKASALEPILREVKGIDVVVLGGAYSYRNLMKEKRPIIVSSPSLGKYAGYVTLELDKKKNIISEHRQQVALSEKIADDPELAALSKEFEQKSKEMRRRRAGTASHKK